MLGIGTLLALSGAQPITIILTAQFANGLLLPVITAFLLYAMNNRALLGDYTNGILANTLGTMVFLISVGLGIRLVLTSVGVI